MRSRSRYMRPSAYTLSNLDESRATSRSSSPRLSSAAGGRRRRRPRRRRRARRGSGAGVLSASAAVAASSPSTANIRGQQALHDSIPPAVVDGHPMKSAEKDSTGPAGTGPDMRPLRARIPSGTPGPAGGCGATPPPRACASACSRSAHRSSTCSMPAEMRISPSGIPARRAALAAQHLVRRVRGQRRQRLDAAQAGAVPDHAQRGSPRAAPPRRRRAPRTPSSGPKPLRICRAAIA